MADRVLRSIRLAVAGVIIASLSVLASGGSAHAATGSVGQYGPGEGHCEQSRILATAPNMSPAPRDNVGNGWSMGGGQWVAFRSHLTRYYPGAGWRTVASAQWKKAFVAYDQRYMGAESWTTLSGQPVSPSHAFGIGYYGTWESPVYYAVYSEYYWYADADHRSDGYDWGWNPHREQRLSAYDTSAYPWCKYPGANRVY